jgi:exopolysaccharide biosynthesis polyprenyl glycosylphosphotransferase
LGARSAGAGKGGLIKAEHEIPLALPQVARSRAIFGGHVRREFVMRRLLAAADIGAMTVALAFVAIVDGQRIAFHLGSWLVLLPVWVLLFKAYGLYDRDGKRVSHSTVDDMPWIFHALVTGTIFFWVLLAAVPELRLKLGASALLVGSGFIAVFVCRAAVRAAAVRALPPERVLFVGGGAIANLLAEKIRSHPEYGLDPIGYIDSLDHGSSALAWNVPYLGAIEQLRMLCHEQGVQRIVVASPAVDDDEVPELIRIANDLDVRISILPHSFNVLGPSVTIDHVEGVTVLGLNAPALTPSSRFLKRAMDLALAVPALIAMLPVMGLTALVVKSTSEGPILFAQERIGRAGRRFRILKFRTMVPDADDLVSDLQALSKHPAWLLLEHDPRITPVGRFLRRASLDELPQLWNVVRGDMSLVGPRPMPPQVDELIAGWGRHRLDLTPGITGLWQVLGRTNIPFEEMVKLDYLYVTNWSLWQDVRLLIQTLPAVIRRRGVN